MLATIALVSLQAFALQGCRSGRVSGDIAVLEPEPVVTPPPPPPLPLPSVTPPLPATASILDLADHAFEAADYDAALVGYQSHLDSDPAGPDADRALYRLAVLHLMSGGPARDPVTGYALLRRLVREHPESPYRIEAEVILGLTVRVDGLETEIERLESQLEALKRIDLENAPDRHSP